MLKVKKIMESVIPKTAVISEEEKIVVKTLADDGAVYYESTYNTLALNVNEYSNEISLELAIEASDYYGLTKEQAERLASECIETVKQNWEKIAAKNGLSRGAIEYMRPAFSLCK